MKNRGYLVFAAVALVIIVGAVALVWKPEIKPVNPPDANELADRTLVDKGWMLAQIGNCASCHTADGGAAYAGGHPVVTPFGTIYASNITPDADTGIGLWSEAAFRRAMREGIDREGGHLYPAFPYDHFAKTSGADLKAIYAYLRTLRPVENRKPSNDLPFPFNMRALMAGWNLLFLDSDMPAPVEGKGEEWNRGRYLAEGIAHCGACHTPRNVLGAEQSSKKFEGAQIEGWHAPALVGNAAAPWAVEDLARYLATGWSAGHGGAAGPMAETAVNLSRAAPADVHAIAVYIADLNGGAQEPRPQIDNASAEAEETTKAIFAGSCANCHESGQSTGPSKALPLSVASSLRHAEPDNAVGIVMNGITDYRGMDGPYMPAFADMLSDDQLVALVAYLRQRYSDGAQWTDIADTVSRVRNAGESVDGS